MAIWSRRSRAAAPGERADEALRTRYRGFRELLSLNNVCLETLASIREDLQYVTPDEPLLAGRVAAVCSGAERAVEVVEGLTDRDLRDLKKAVVSQRREISSFLAGVPAGRPTALAVSLSEVDRSMAAEVGSKAASLGEIKNELRLPVPDGFVVTAEAYRRFCEEALWERIRDATREADLGELEALRGISSRLEAHVMERVVPAAVAGAIRAGVTELGARALAVRSSAVGEGGERSFAGQFLSLLDVWPGGAVDAYRRVVASRFSERALCYRLSIGLAEVESPMAVLVMPLIRARATGVLYTSDPAGPKKGTLWITATRGVAGGTGDGVGHPADLFVVERRRGHRLLEQTVVAGADGVAASPTLGADELKLLADRGLAIERHFGRPQDIEWAFDETGRLWVLQSRPLATAASSSSRDTTSPSGPLLSGGRSVCPGRASGPAWLAAGPGALRGTPDGAILFLRRASPEIVEVFPRIAGLVAESGNLTGHAAALLREFKIPSVFQLTDAFTRLSSGDPVSLDATRGRIFGGVLWPSSPRSLPATAPRARARDALEERLLALHLLDPASFAFRPSRCRSLHDVLRFCHEKAIEAMFVANDSAREREAAPSTRLLARAPLNLHVLDLGGGLSETGRTAAEVSPSEIRSRPFQALWQGICHPEVTWTRGMPAPLGGLASVMATSLLPSDGAIRALGEKSYLLVADEYMNLNSRLAFHFTLVDACVSEDPGHNHISFRFAGGGADRSRRDLRARFIEGCLLHHGFCVDRRGDLVNAWFRKAPPAETEERLDVLGRLMASSSQLDMYMSSDTAMEWYVQQFLGGNYAFRTEGAAAGA